VEFTQNETKPVNLIPRRMPQQALLRVAFEAVEGFAELEAEFADEDAVEFRHLLGVRREVPGGDAVPTWGGGGGEMEECLTSG
jgi:hypothetical protein